SLRASAPSAPCETVRVPEATATGECVSQPWLRREGTEGRRLRLPSFANAQQKKYVCLDNEGVANDASPAHRRTAAKPPPNEGWHRKQTIVPTPRRARGFLRSGICSDPFR